LESSVVQKEKAGGNEPADFRGRREMHNHLIFLPLIIVVCDVKVKVVLRIIFRKHKR